MFCPPAVPHSFPKSPGCGLGLPPLADLFVYDGSGVMPGRTWVIAPDRTSLERRWEVLHSEADPTKKEGLFHPHLRKGKPGDKHSNKRLRRGIYGHDFRAEPVAIDQGVVIRPARGTSINWSIPGDVTALGA